MRSASSAVPMNCQKRLIPAVPWRLAAIVAALAGAFLFVGVASSQTTVDHPYQIEINITNNAADDYVGPAPISINADNLADAGYIDPDGKNTLFIDSSNSPVSGAAQDLDSDGANWWWPVNISDGSVGQIKLLAGGPDEDHQLLLGGGADRIVVPDSSTLDVSNQTTTLSVMANLDEAPASGEELYYVLKRGNYGLGLVGAAATTTLKGIVWKSGRIVGRWYGPSGTVSSTGFTLTGCTAPHLCLTVDSTAAYLSSSSGGSDEVVVDLNLPSAVTNGSIESLRVHIKNKGASPCTNAVKVGFKLGTDESLANGYCTGANSWSSSILIATTAPDGGPWTKQKMEDVQAIIKATYSGYDIRWLGIEVYYYPAATVSYVLPAGVTGLHTAQLTYDRSNLKLYWDRTQVATTPLTGNLNTTNEPLVIMEGSKGSVTETKVERGVSTVLDFDYEPSSLSQTQAGSSDNSWLWKSSVDDATSNNNDGTWHVTADTSNLGIAVGALQIAPDTPPAAVEIEKSDIVGDRDVKVFQKREPTISSPISDQWWGFIENLGMPLEAAGLLVVMTSSIFITGRLYKVWPSMAVSVGVAGVLYLLGAMLGFYAWYVVAFGLMFAVLGTLGMHQYMGRS